MQTHLPRTIARLFALFVLCSPFYGYSQPTEQIIVAVNASVPVKQLSPSQLRRIFTMRQNQWPNGESITVFVLSNNNPYHQLFSKTMLSLFPYQLDRLWDKLMYSGQGERPIEVKDMTEMQLQISNTPGSIGYITTTKPLKNISAINVKVDE